MSAEKHARSLVRRMVFWRILGGLLELPGRLCGVMVVLFTHLRNVLDDVSISVFYFELEAARKYRLLTGSDLGLSSGSPHRYSSLSRTFTDAVEDKIVRDQEGQ